MLENSRNDNIYANNATDNFFSPMYPAVTKQPSFMAELIV